MYVLSHSFVLPDEVPPLSHPVIGWDNIVAIDNIVADGEDPDHPATNLANSATHLLWKSDDDAEQYLTITTGTADALDYVGIANHNFGSAGIAVSVEGDAGDGYEQIVQPFIPGDDGPLILRFTPDSFIAVRVKLAAGSAPPEAAVLFLGKLLIMQKGLVIDAPHVPIKYGRKARSIDGMSERGEWLGRVVVSEWRESHAIFAHLTEDWYREKMDPFIAASKERPFFFAWKPQTYPREVGYAWMTNDPMPETDHATSRIRIELQMNGIV